MLTYEYQCESCGHEFERRQAITEAAIAQCPECRGRVRRLISGGAGIIIKRSSHAKAGPKGGGCSWEQEGRTCCGRDERCGKPPCGGG